MPVHLDAVPQAMPIPAPPRPVVWLLLLACFVSTGAALTLLLWPRGASTTDGRFWLYLAGLPALAWILALGIRVLVHDLICDLARTRNRRREVRLASETRRGQLPMLVLGSAYETALGNADLDTKLVNGGIGLQTVYPAADSNPVQCSTLPSGLRLLTPDSQTLTVLFKHLLQRVEPQLQALPAVTPIRVWLQVDAGIETIAVRQAWEAALTGGDSRLADVQLVAPHEGLLLLDRWLDSNRTANASELYLIIALQSHATPVDGSGEAAAALLLARNFRNPEHEPLAILHRPVPFTSSDVRSRLADALLWGTEKPEEIGTFWTATLGVTNTNLIASAVRNARIGEKADDGLVHLDVDTALGNTGAAASWLAAVAAIERCRKEKQPQLVTAEENGDGRLFVVAPAINPISA